jgi:hypothetical protein
MCTKKSCEQRDIPDFRIGNPKIRHGSRVHKVLVLNIKLIVNFFPERAPWSRPDTSIIAREIVQPRMIVGISEEFCRMYSKTQQGNICLAEMERAHSSMCYLEPIVCLA